eukprot:UN03117
MENMWTHVFDQLNIQDSDGAPDGKLLLTESPGGPKANREKCMQLAFEKYNFNKFYISLDAVLALYQGGRTTGCVFDSGFGTTHAVPIYEGYALPHAILKEQTAGNAVTKELQNLLSKNKKGHLSYEIVEDIKIKHAYVQQKIR